MNQTIQPLSPLWESFPTRQAQPAGIEQRGGSIFADIFHTAIDNVRESEKDVAKKEYLLSTGQLDNPAEMNMATYKAEAAISLLVQLRERAMNAYNELSRISL